MYKLREAVEVAVHGDLKGVSPHRPLNPTLILFDISSLTLQSSDRMLMLQTSEWIDSLDTHVCPTYGLVPEQISHASMIAATPGIFGIC